MRIRDGCSLRQESEGVWNLAMGMYEVYEERIHSCATDPSSSASCILLRRASLFDRDGNRNMRSYGPSQGCRLSFSSCVALPIRPLHFVSLTPAAATGNGLKRTYHRWLPASAYANTRRSTEIPTPAAGMQNGVCGLGDLGFEYHGSIYILFSFRHMVIHLIFIYC